MIIPREGAVEKLNKEFARDARGNVAITFSIMLLPLIGMTGLAIDVSRALATKSTLDASADAAALSAATEAMATMQSTSPFVTPTITNAIQAGTQAGTAMFGVDAARVYAGMGGVPTPSVNVVQKGQMLIATVTYASNVPMTFGKMFGAQPMAISGSATASLTMPKYMNISVATDISQSMGLASTSSGIIQLQGLTGGCAFGCHVYQPGQTGVLPYDQQAHNAGIQLRIDVIHDATISMINTAQALQSGAPLISFGLYTMQYGLATLSPSTNNYVALKTAAAGITLGANNSSGVGDSNFAAAMPTLTSTVPTSGDGSSNGSPQQYVFLMTDGVQDVYGNCTDGHCTQAFDPAQCKALKDKGVIVGVIYTTYLPLPGEQTYQDLVAPFVNNLPVNLTACATPGWFYQATNANDIQNAVNALFGQATGHAVLTQ